MKHISIRRVFDFLAIVGLAVLLLGLAWRVGKVTSQNQMAREEVPVTTVENLSDTPELQLRLPLERIGMELSREAIPGNSAPAIAHLEGQCCDVLAESDRWVLSLAISEEERKLLESIKDVSPIISGAGSGETRLPIFPVTLPTGRVGIREFASTAGEAASPGRRLLCWGFILGEGTESQTVWFARPREKLPLAEPLSSAPSPSSPHKGHAP